MPAHELITVGPWSGGLNSSKEPFSLEDNELAECLNMEVLDNGALRVRRGYHLYFDPTNRYLDPTLGGAEDPTKMVVVGKVKNTVLFAANGTVWRIIPDSDEVAYTDTIPSVGSAASPSGVVTYKDFVYILFANGTNSASPGKMYRFPLANLGSAAAGFASVANGPHADFGFIIKDRMVVVQTEKNIIYWSKATDPTIWAAPDGGFVEVNPGDGDQIVSVIHINDILYIFKRNSIWVFTFTSDPAVDGALVRINEEMGGCACEYGGSIFFVNLQGVYKLINNTPYKISDNISFVRSSVAVSTEVTDPGHIWAYDDRLYVLARDNGSAFGEGYMLNLNNSAWSRLNRMRMMGWNLCRSSNLGGWVGGIHPIYGYGPFSAFSESAVFIQRDPALELRYLFDVDAAGVATIPPYKILTKPYELGEHFRKEKISHVYINAQTILNDTVDDDYLHSDEFVAPFAADKSNGWKFWLNLGGPDRNYNPAGSFSSPTGEYSRYVASTYEITEATTPDNGRQLDSRYLRFGINRGTSVQFRAETEVAGGGNGVITVTPTTYARLAESVLRGFSFRVQAKNLKLV